MRGVIMETKNGRAVLLTRGGEFVNIKDKNYSVGDKVNITLNTGRLCAMAASLVIICAGVSSYFMPAGYVGVDINPSLIMTVNIYNRVIDVKSLNEDARVLLDKTDIKGKSAEDSVEMLIKTSEDIGYINDDNNSVILDVVSGIAKPNIENVKYNNIDITKETADMKTLRISQNIGVSIAKVKALEEYTEKNGGDMRSNAAKFNDKSVKEIRKIMLDNDNLPDKKADNAPLQNPKPQENSDNISKPQKPQENYKPSYSINNNSFRINEPKRNTPSYNRSPQIEYRPTENISVRDDNKPQERPSALNGQPHWDIIENQSSQSKPQNNSFLKDKLQQTGESEKTTVDRKPVQTEQKPQDNTSHQSVSKPGNGNSDKNESKHEDKPIDKGHKTAEEKPSIQNQDGGKAPDNPPQSGGQKTTPFDKQQSSEQKPNTEKHDNDKPQDLTAAPAEPEYEHDTGKGNQSIKASNDTYSPNNAKEDKPKQKNNAPQSGPKPQVNVPENNNAQQQSKPKREDNMPPQAEPKPQKNTPNNNAPQHNFQQNGEAKHGNNSPENEQPRQAEPKPQTKAEKN